MDTSFRRLGKVWKCVLRNCAHIQQRMHPRAAVIQRSVGHQQVRGSGRWPESTQLGGSDASPESRWPRRLRSSQSARAGGDGGGSAGQAGLAGTREGGRQEPGAGPGARALARTRRRAAGPRGKEEGEREIGGGVERISALADK